MVYKDHNPLKIPNCLMQTVDQIIHRLDVLGRILESTLKCRLKQMRTFLQ